MRTTGVLRLLVLAAVATAASAHETAMGMGTDLTATDATTTVREVVPHAQVARALHKKEVTSAPTTEEEEEEEEEAPAVTTTKPVAATHKQKHTKATEAPATEAPATQTPAPVATTATPETAAPTTAPVTHKPKKTKSRSTDDEEPAPAPAPTPTPTSKAVSDKRTKGYNNTGVIDGSSEGSSEIDKIDLRNQDSWVSVYNDPPLLVIKASLYAFISYNDSRVCDSFNMTLNAVEQKPDGNGTFSYHVVTYINCTKDAVDETPGRFILNFIPEGKRLLLTECGHREEGEILNWLKIKEEVPECMTPHERKSFLAQPMKHIHASNGTTDAAPKQTDFFTRLEELDGREVAIAGSATVALIAVIVVIAVFVVRKRKAQKDLERTIAGAKADHADDDEDKDKDEESPTADKEKKEKKKEKTGDEEGSFVNSPAVKV